MKRAFLLMRCWLLLPILVIVCSSHYAFANKRLDSLFSAYKSKPFPDSILVPFARQNIYPLIGDYPDSVIKMVNKLINFRDKRPEPETYIRLLNGKAIAFERAGKPQQAHKVLDHAIEIAEKYQLYKQQSALYLAEGIAYKNEGHFDTALNRYKKALEATKYIKPDLRFLAICYANIGNIHQHTQNYDKALEYFFKTLEMQPADDLKRPIASAHIGAGLVFMAQEKFDKAEYHFQEGSKIRIGLNDLGELAITYHNLGILYRKMGNNKQAKNYFELGLEVNRKISYHKGVLLGLVGMGEYLASINKGTEALPYCLEALDMAKRESSKINKQLTYECLYQAYHANRDYKKAFEYYHLYIQTRDSIYNEDNSRKLYNQQLQLEYEMQAYADSLENEREKGLKAIAYNAEIAKQKVKSKAYLIGGALVVCLALLSLMLYRQKSRNRLLHITGKKELEKQNAVLKMQEDERKRIGKELHDGIGGRLASIMFKLQSKEETDKFNQLLLDDLSSACNELRTVSHNLNMVELENSTLAELINSYAKNITENASIEVSLTFKNEHNIVLPLTTKQHVLRIVQELISNTLKHANASLIAIDVLITEKEMDICYVDDGDGMKENPQEGLGSKSIRTRVATLQGKLEYLPNEGNGFVANMKIPVHG